MRWSLLAALVAIVVLFLLGIALSYFVVLPLTLQFLMSIESTALTPMISATDYFDFAISMCLAFGGVFEVPIVIVGLSALGIVSPQTLGKFRRYALVISYGAAAIITPGDLLTTTIALAIPLYLLYEMSVAVAYVIYRKKQRRDAEVSAEEGVPA